jgi:hypothetical protein
MGLKSVLLARPHPLIVEHMREFVERLGFQPVPIAAVDEIAKTPSRGLAGVVISTTVKSVVTATYAEVLHIVRTHHPNVPVLFATLADPRSIAANLEALVQRMGAGRVALTREIATDDRQLGHRDYYLLATKAEIAGASKTSHAGRIVARHFS